MKKIVALALAVIMTMTMFCALTVTSSADDVKYDATTKIVVTDNEDGTSNVKVYFYDESEFGFVGTWLALSLENIEFAEQYISVQGIYSYFETFASEEGWIYKVQNVYNLGTKKKPVWVIDPADFSHLTEGNTKNINIPWYADATTPFSLKADVLSQAKGKDFEEYYEEDLADYLEEDGSLLLADFNIVTPKEDASIEIHPIKYDEGNFTINTEIPMATYGKKPGVGYWDKYEFKGEVVVPVVPAEVKVAGTSVRYTNPQGLRFVAEITANDQVVDGAGIVITADGSDVELDVPAMLYLDDAKTTYTAVLANIKATNYKRTFTATPYIVVNGERVVGAAGSANAHDVAVEILANEPDFGHEDRPDYATVAMALLNLYAGN